MTIKDEAGNPLSGLTVRIERFVPTGNTLVVGSSVTNAEGKTQELFGETWYSEHDTMFIVDTSNRFVFK